MYKFSWFRSGNPYYFSKNKERKKENSIQNWTSNNCLKHRSRTQIIYDKMQLPFNLQNQIRDFQLFLKPWEAYSDNSYLSANGVAKWTPISLSLSL